MSRTHIVLVIVQKAFALALMYACFCRVVKTNAETIREIRWAIWLEGVAAGLVFGAPVLPELVYQFRGTGTFFWQPGHTPVWIYVLLLIAAALVQFSTARFWRYGPPCDFQTRGFL